MVPPLALVAKRFLPLECQASIQEYAADKRAPHPVALLVKRVAFRWRESPWGRLTILEIDNLNPDLCPIGRGFYKQWAIGVSDGIFDNRRRRTCPWSDRVWIDDSDSE